MCLYRSCYSDPLKCSTWVLALDIMIMVKDSICRTALWHSNILLSMSTNHTAYMLHIIMRVQI